MLRFIFICLIVLCCTAALNAQQKRPPYGPVVTAYLTSLSEELNELNFQLRQREISRAEYDRTRQRLLILRRLVQERARQSRADAVPELQVLQLDEFGMVGLSQPPEPERLRPGNIFDESWRLVGIETTKPPFYVFEKVPLAALNPRANGQAGPSDGAPEPLPQRSFDPLEAIETIVVPDPEPMRSLATRPRSVVAGNDGLLRPEPQNGNDTAEEVLTGPLVLKFALPEYTDEARTQGVEGDLALRATFQLNGEVKNVTVEKGLGFGLDERAAAVVQAMEFEPARIGERSIEARAEIIFSFKLAKVLVRIRNVTPE